MTMAQFVIGDGGEEEGTSQIEECEREEITHKKRATVRESHEMFVTKFGSCSLSELRVAVAPGRVNLIGDHVDYCDGVVLPMAIPLYTVAIGRRAANQERGFTEVYSVHFNETVKIYTPYHERNETYPHWALYVQGVLALLSSLTSFPLIDILIHSHIPPGASLSSSAALELAVLHLALQFAPEGFRLSTTDGALLCQKAEHEYADIPCGIMDQMVVAVAQDQRALKLDCLSLEYESIPMSIAHDVVFLVSNSGVKAEDAMASGEYAKRRSDVEKAVKLIGANSWRDVNEDRLRESRASLSGMGEHVLQRATHVVEEIARTLDAANALLDNNILLFGKLMTASHESLKELDELVDIALSVDGVFGARMTGGGFGGCTVSLVRRDAVNKLKNEIKTRYTGGKVSFVECEPVGGVSSFSLDFLVPPNSLR